MQRQEKMHKNADPRAVLKQPLEIVWQKHSERLGQLQIPRIMVAAAAVIETDLDAEGLFRIPGSSKRASKTTAYSIAPQIIVLLRHLFMQNRAKSRDLRCVLHPACLAGAGCKTRLRSRVCKINQN